ncbi:hypothetical protein IWX92DRAFT_384787 [Phyllosticta citricarpa]
MTSQSTHTSPGPLIPSSTIFSLDNRHVLSAPSLFLPFLLSVVVQGLAARSNKRSNSKALLPPTPPGAWPLLGRLPQFISAAKARRLHLLVEQWIREYGKEEGLVRVRVAGVEVVHVGKDEAAKEKGWGRPPVCAIVDVVLLKTTLTGVSRADAGVPFLERESLAFLHKVAHDPGVARNSKRIMETSARYTYSAFAQQTFGLEVTQHAERDVLCHIHGKSKQISTDRFEGDNTTVSREEETLGGSQTDGEKPQQSANLVDPAQRDHFAFGAGRRICPGTNVAERSLAIAMMRILWAFNVRPSTTASHPLDPRDLPGDPPGNLSDEMSVVLEPKSVKMARAIDEAWSREKTEFPRRARRCL